MTLKIYNTLSSQKEAFKPIEPGKIGLYVCGITVYDYCHIGHARVLITFDVITRYLRSQGWQVNYTRNITDIDDKILHRAQENKENYTALTTRFIDAMHDDEKQLAILPPDQEPRATAHIDDIINMIKCLEEKGYAYATDSGDVYYRVQRFANYGKLSGKDPERMMTGVRIEIDEGKEDPRDFALWKAASADEVSWPSPWGEGRPGWHIECSAMSKACLGNHFDMHGGGPDLLFPHHENEIAQSEAANDCRLANYWLHAGAVRIDGEKMSKSKNNFFTIREVLKEYHPEVIRYLIVSTHYRSHINYSENNLIEARVGLERFYIVLKEFGEIPPLNDNDLQVSDYYRRFVEAMNDDFNTRIALAVMYDMVKTINIAITNGDRNNALSIARQLITMGGILGILQHDATDFLQSGSKTILSLEDIERLIAERDQAKQAKNYRRADDIRQQLKTHGIILEDSRQGTGWRRE